MFPFKQNKFVFQTETSSMSDKQSVYVFDKNLKKKLYPFKHKQRK